MLFGTLGTLTRFIELPPAALTLGRAVIAVATIALYFALTKQKIDFKAIRANIKTLILLGCLMSFNWVCQFIAFNHTTIAISTVCYYTQSLFLIIGAALIYHERLSTKKFICILTAFFGMILVSGVLSGEGITLDGLKGIIFSLLGAITYAIVVLINKGLKNISTMDTTMAQLFFAAIIVLPYTLITEDVSAIHLSLRGFICLLILGALHTGIAYVVYFGAVKTLQAQTVAIISYIDPVEAVMLSAFFLREPITAMVVIGAAMILGATAFSELGDARKSSES